MIPTRRPRAWRRPRPVPTWNLRYRVGDRPGPGVARTPGSTQGRGAHGSGPSGTARLVIRPSWRRRYRWLLADAWLVLRVTTYGALIEVVVILVMTAGHNGPPPATSPRWLPPAAPSATSPTTSPTPSAPQLAAPPPARTRAPAPSAAVGAPPAAPTAEVPEPPAATPHSAVQTAPPSTSPPPSSSTTTPAPPDEPAPTSSPPSSPPPEVPEPAEVPPAEQLAQLG